jgi:hypothetical protein
MLEELAIEFGIELSHKHLIARSSSVENIRKALLDVKDKSRPHLSPEHRAHGEKESRLANDGKFYTHKEFVEYYGQVYAQQRWERATAHKATVPEDGASGSSAFKQEGSLMAGDNEDGPVDVAFEQVFPSTSSSVGFPRSAYANQEPSQLAQQGIFAMP